jgi:hypothetical protein
MLTAASILASLLVGYMVGLYGFTRASDAAFRRLVAAQTRSYSVLPEDVQ